MNLEQLWNTVLEKMHDSLNSIHYDTWFKETKINSIENGIIKIISRPLVKRGDKYEHQY